MNSVYGMDRTQLIDQTRVLSSQKKFKQAQRAYLNYLKKNPNDVEIMFMLGNTYSWDKNYSDAKRYYNKASKIKPDYLPALLGPIRILSWEEKYDQALKELVKLGKQFPNQTELLNLKARIYSWKKEIKKSLRIYKRSLKIDPNNIETLEGMATIYRWLGMNGRQLFILRKLMKLSPNNPDYLFQAAITYRNLKRIKTALTYFRRAKSLPGADKERLEAEILFTRTLLEQNRQEQIQLKENVALDKSDVEQFIQQGRIYSWNQKNKEAIKLFRRALKKSPRHIDALLGLGNTYYFGGQWDNALSVFRRADRIKPNDPEILKHIEKVEKLMRPFFQVQFRRFSFDDKIKTTTLNYTQETILDRYSIFYKQSLTSRFEIRTEYHQEKMSNKDSDFTLFNYQLKGNSVALETNYRFKNRLDWRFKVFANQFDNDKNNENVYSLNSKEKYLSGYTLLRKEWGRHYLSTSFSRESIISLNSSDFTVNYHRLSSIDLFDSIEFTNQFTTTVGFRGSQIHETDRKFYQYSVKPIYRPEQLRNFEASLEYRTQDEKDISNFNTTTFALSYFQHLYKFFFDITSSVSFTTFDKTWGHDNRLTIRYQLPWKMVFNTELNYFYEFDGDEDTSTSLLFNIGRAF